MGITGERKKKAGTQNSCDGEEASGPGLTDTAWPGDWRKRLSREFLSQRKEVVTLKSVATAVLSLSCNTVRIVYLDAFPITVF